MRWFPVALVLALALMWSTAQSVRAAGFDCEKFRSASEKTMCADDAAVSEADQAMAATYDAIMAALTTAEQTEPGSEQEEWLRTRTRQCGDDVTCLLETTVKRHRLLTARKTLVEEARNDPVLIAETPEQWNPGLLVICSPKLGIFDIRLPLNEETSLDGLADDERKRLEFAGFEVASMDCKLNQDLTLTLKFRDSPYHGGGCGGVWQPVASIWINGRRIHHHAQFFAEYCVGETTQSITIEKGVVRLCWSTERVDLMTRRDCRSQPLAIFLDASPDPGFAPKTPVKERLILIDGKEDSFCQSVFQRWLSDEQDALEDLLETDVDWAPVPQKHTYDFYSVTETDLDGDGNNEVIARHAYESRASSGDRFVIARDRQLVVSRAGGSIWDLDQALNQAAVPHIKLFNETSFPSDHYTIDIMKKGDSGKRLLLVRYTFETIYRSHASSEGEIRATRVIGEVNSSLEFKSRCKIGPKIHKGDFL